MKDRVSSVYLAKSSNQSPLKKPKQLPKTSLNINHNHIEEIGSSQGNRNIADVLVETKYSSKSTEFHEIEQFNLDVHLFKQFQNDPSMSRLNQSSPNTNHHQSAQELKKLLVEKQHQNKKFFSKLANDIMKLPEVNDEHEQYLRAHSPADTAKQYVPKIPHGLQISRLHADVKGEFIPDYITLGLKERHEIRVANAQRA